MRGAADPARQADARIIVILVGHVTKEGAIAGPRVLEHIVDTVLYFEGDTHSSFRLVRAIKNRFGAANELGVFAMTERGLKGVANPSALFLSQHGRAGRRQPRSSRRSKARGRCWSRSRRWSIRSQGGMPRRLAVGLDPQRLALLLAVLHRHGGVETGGYDVFVNAVGGVRINEPAADLAVLAGDLFVVEKQAARAQIYCLWRSRAGGRNPAGAARPGTDPRGREAGLHDAR